MAKPKRVENPARPALLKELFAVRLREIALELGDYPLVQERTGLSPSDLYNHMRARGNPTIETIRAVAERFGKSDFEFLNLKISKREMDRLARVREELRTAHWDFDVAETHKRG